MYRGSGFTAHCLFALLLLLSMTSSTRTFRLPIVLAVLALLIAGIIGSPVPSMVSSSQATTYDGGRAALKAVPMQPTVSPVADGIILDLRAMLRSGDPIQQRSALQAMVSLQTSSSEGIDLSPLMADVEALASGGARTWGASERALLEKARRAAA